MLHKMYTSVTVLSISSQQVHFNNPKSVNDLFDLQKVILLLGMHRYENFGRYQ